MELIYESRPNTANFCPQDINPACLLDFLEFIFTKFTDVNIYQTLLVSC